MDLDAPPRRRARVATTSRPNAAAADVLAALKALGLVCYGDANGVVHIICSFVYEHTERDDTGTA